MNVHVVQMPASASEPVRHDWTRAEAEAIHDLPFNDLLFRAATVQRRHFDPNKVQLARLLSIKTGGCAEDCGYCSQSAHHAAGTGLKASKLMEVERVVDEARKAKAQGATRYCMGAAWRSPKGRDMDAVVAMVEGVRALGMETCMTLGMLSDGDVAKLKDAGLDYYNHNIDTSERYYSEIVKTRTFADRLDTLARVRDAGIKVCSGGIVGLGETVADRIDMLVTLANLDTHPESVPINMLIAIPGTPLEDREKVDPIAFVRIIALARIMMPASFVRLSAGRTEMSEETQALCFFAGANSIFCGDTLLTADNPGEDKDQALFRKLGLEPMPLGTEDGAALSPRSGIDFSSNDYLGLAASRELAHAVAQALDRGVAVGAGGSRLLRGNDPEHEALEAEAQAFFGAESCLYFGGGFLANYALFSTLPARNDLVVHDALIHASVIDGMRAGKAATVAAAHNDAQSFDDAIARWRSGGGTGRPWIAVESLYSMDGDCAPLADLIAIARRHDGRLVVDEAHATGVLGPDGRGLAHALEGAPDVISLHTCGKALGASGALLLAPRLLRDYLVNRARALIYATAPSPLMAAAVRASLHIVRSDPGRRDRLAKRVAFAGRTLERRCGITPSGSHIQPVILGSDERALEIAKALIAGGFDVRAVRPPTVPEGTARLRISLTLNAGEDATARLLDTLAALLERVPA